MQQKNPEVVVKEWLERAKEDMKSARVMLETNHFIKEVQRHIFVSKIIGIN